jgi:para-nitrobenzyl esterase
MDVVVRTRSGDVRGHLIDGVATFKGISYAAPPFGPNRFEPPRLATPWDGVRDALAYGPTAPKPPYPPPIDSILPEPTIAGEDCLNLNVWSPDLAASGLPVMVWIHGGAFVNGSGAVPTYDGSRFARDGVVCVTINYRLGVDGFLYLGDGTANLGLLDQIAALTWVQENVAAFGGDPGNVTIFGESAGGMSVTCLLSMPRAAGLFRRVIAQSGAGHHVLSLGTAERVGRYLAAKLEVEPTRAAIAAVPIDRLIVAQESLAADFGAAPSPARWGEIAANLMVFEPVVDGDVLPARPIDGIVGGAGAGVDLMVGTNSDEWRLFVVPSGAIDYINEAILSGAISAYGLPVAETLATYRGSRPNASAGDLFVAVATDWFFRMPAIRLAEARLANNGSVHMYEFAWRSPGFGGRLGACHGLEIPFAFDTLESAGSEGLLGTVAAAQRQLATAMHAAWVGFATRRDPGWPRYDRERRATITFDLTSAVVDDPRSAERALWEGVR